MQQVMYIGPTIHKLGLIRNQVYLGGIPAQVRVTQTQYPEVSELIVPIESIPEAMDKARTKGEHLHHVVNELIRKTGSRGYEF